MRPNALKPRRAPLVLALLLGLSSLACGGSARHYERAGMAGAGLVLGGFAVNLVGHSTIPPRNEAGLRAVTATGATMEVVGFVLAIYALDGLISATSDPNGPGR